MGVYVVGYWSINGKPACRSKEASSCGVDLQCSCTPKVYKKQSAILLQHYPDAVVEHHIGEPCPVYRQEQAEDQDRMDAMEEWTREKFAVDNEQ